MILAALMACVQRAGAGLDQQAQKTIPPESSPVTAAHHADAG